MQSINDAILELITHNQHLAEERASSSLVMSPEGIPEFTGTNAELNNSFSFVRHSSLRKIISGSLKVAGL